MPDSVGKAEMMRRWSIMDNTEEEDIKISQAKRGKVEKLVLPPNSSHVMEAIESVVASVSACKSDDLDDSNDCVIVDVVQEDNSDSCKFPHIESDLNISSVSSAVSETYDHDVRSSFHAAIDGLPGVTAEVRNFLVSIPDKEFSSLFNAHPSMLGRVSEFKVSDDGVSMLMDDGRIITAGPEKEFKVQVVTENLSVASASKECEHGQNSDNAVASLFGGVLNDDLPVFDSGEIENELQAVGDVFETPELTKEEVLGIVGDILSFKKARNPSDCVELLHELRPELPAERARLIATTLVAFNKYLPNHFKMFNLYDGRLESDTPPSFATFMKDWQFDK
jgi:hypothetical protein